QNPRVGASAGTSLDSSTTTRRDETKASHRTAFHHPEIPRRIRPHRPHSSPTNRRPSLDCPYTSIASYDRQFARVNCYLEPLSQSLLDLLSPQLQPPRFHIAPSTIAIADAEPL
ncbi:hypothetical protein IFR05_016998, partial [Cadophora sp. M221]